MLTGFSALALLLGAVLCATVIGALLAQQVRQIAIMKAIGARTQQVALPLLALVAGLGLMATAIGLPLGVEGRLFEPFVQGEPAAGAEGGLGIGLALVGTRLLRSLLFGTSPTDAVTFVAVSTLLVVIAAAASLVPALRASRASSSSSNVGMPNFECTPAGRTGW